MPLVFHRPHQIQGGWREPTSPKSIFKPLCFCPPKVTLIKGGMFLNWLSRSCWTMEFTSAWKKMHISSTRLCQGLWLGCAQQKGGRKGTLWNCSEHLSRLNSILDTNVKDRLPWLLLLAYWGAMWRSIERRADNDTTEGAGSQRQRTEREEGWPSRGRLGRLPGRPLPGSHVHAGTRSRIRELLKSQLGHRYAVWPLSTA